MKKNLKIMALLMSLIMAVTFITPIEKTNVNAATNCVLIQYSNGGVFDRYGVTSKSYQYAIGGTADLSKLTKPYRNGYSLIGWAHSPSAGVQYSVTSKVPMTGSKVLYAIWKKLPSLTYYDNYYGGGCKVEYINSSTGKVGITTTVPTRKGYEFLGWSKINTATSPAYKGGNLMIMNGNTALYGVWKPYLTKENMVDRMGCSNAGNKNYALTLDDYKLLFGDNIGKQYYEYDIGNNDSMGTSGVCYGFSLTEGALLRNQIKPKMFGKSSLYSIKEEDIYKTFSFNQLENITIYKYLQYAWKFYNTQYAKENTQKVDTGKKASEVTADLKKFVDNVKKYANNGTKSYELSMWAADCEGTNKGKKFAHSMYILGLGADEADTIGNYTPIYLYDCNNRDQVNTLKIYKNKDGDYYRVKYSNGNGMEADSQYTTLIGKDGTYSTRPFMIAYFDMTNVWYDNFLNLSKGGIWVPSNTSFVTSETLEAEDINAADVSEITELDDNVNSDEKAFWVKGDTVILNNLEKNESFSVADNESVISVTTSKNTDIRLRMEDKDILKFDTKSIKEINYKQGKTKYKITPSGDDTITIKMDKKGIVVDKANKAVLKIEKNKEVKTIKKGFNNGTYKVTFDKSMNISKTKETVKINK